MRAFQKHVQDTRSIPSTEKESWISEMKAGNEGPFIALVFLQLDHLTSLVIVTGLREDFFISETLQRIAKEHNSPSLSRLRTVRIICKTPCHSGVQYLTAFAALPSVVSLSACEVHDMLLNGGSLDTAEQKFEVASQSSNIQDLDIHVSFLSDDTLFKLVRSAKSLRSFSYTFTFWGTRPFPARLCEILHLLASTSLEELKLYCYSFEPILVPLEFDFKLYRNLRVLTIDYRLLTSDQSLATDKMVRNLPASLEILGLGNYWLQRLDWLLEFVKGVAKVKGKMLPCLKEVRFEENLGKGRFPQTQIQEICVTAEEAGFTLSFATGDTGLSW